MGMSSYMPFLLAYTTKLMFALITSKDPVEWHSLIAEEFDNKYYRNPDFKERFNLWTKIIVKYSNKEYETLDLGCGSGAFTFTLAKHNKNALGIDASPNMLGICNSKLIKSGRDNIEFKQAYLNSLNDIYTNQADLIISSSVLEYLDNLDESIRIIAQHMKPNGIFILSIPNKQSLYRKLESIMFKLTDRPQYYKHVKNILSLEEIKAVLEKHNIVTLENHFYAATPILSGIARCFGLSRYSDNLILVASQKSPA
jgi:2-polyprenyl-6-hydroxyphenyl methylase/3-demethylubiquinone-9 3-methyltransferase